MLHNASCLLARGLLPEARYAQAKSHSAMQLKWPSGRLYKSKLRRDTVLLKKFYRLPIKHGLRERLLSRLVSLRILNL